VDAVCSCWALANGICVKTTNTAAQKNFNKIGTS
jgi:hypothetical protein